MGERDVRMEANNENNITIAVVPRRSLLLGEICRRYNQRQRRQRGSAMASITGNSSADENPHPAKRNRSRGGDSPVASAMPTPPGTLVASALLGIASSPLLTLPSGPPVRPLVPRLPVHGSMAVLGRRREMEDNVALLPGFGSTRSETYSYYAVYDGHGGKLVAEECRERLHLAVLREAQRQRACGEGEGLAMWARAMATGFAKFDEEIIAELKEMGKGTVGSTAVVALLAEAGWLLVANCGDSRAVLSRGGQALPLSRDHKPDRPDEYRRVQALGGQIVTWDCPRILGMLSTSRAIGDYFLKPYVSCEPEFSVSYRSDEDEFLILASDGLWDTVSNELACNVVRNCLTQPSPGIYDDDVASGPPPPATKATPKDAAAVLVRLAIARGSEDNISAVVVDLRKRVEAI